MEIRHPKTLAIAVQIPLQIKRVFACSKLTHFPLQQTPVLGVHIKAKKREKARGTIKAFFLITRQNVTAGPAYLNLCTPPTNSFPLSTHTTTPHPLFHQSINPHRNLLRFIPSTPIK